MKIMDFSIKNVSPCVVYKTLFLVSMFVSTCVAQAAGLGKLNVNSYLGQPLKAEIALESVTDKEVDTLAAKLASPKIFQKMGINLAPYHAGLSITVEKRVDGQPYIRVTSSQTINEPFLKLLIELHSSSGRMLREYNVLLDPVDTRKPVVAAPVVDKSDESTSIDTTKETRPSAGVGKQSSASRVKPVVPDGNTYGPVMDGDTLSRIARQVSPDGINLNQMLVALYRANRDAFLEKNMNLLKVGVILRIPDESELASITTKESSHEVIVQKESWDSYRQKIAELAGDTSDKSKLKQSQSGKITTFSEESAIPGTGKSEEVLILSKGELLDDSHASDKRADNKVAQNYLHMMEEDAIAKERALHEANERVAILEQNVAKLQRLLELKGEVAENKTKHEPEQAQLIPNSQSALAVAGQSGSVIESTEPTTHTPEKLTLPVTIPVQPVTTKPAQSANPESEESALMDTLIGFVTENTEWTAGGVAALLLSMLGISMARRRREQADAADIENDVYDYVDKDNDSAGSIAEATSSDSEKLIEMNEQATYSAVPGEGNSANSRADVDPGVFFAGKQDETFSENFFLDLDSDKQIKQEDHSIFDELDPEIKISTTEPDQAKYESDIIESGKDDNPGTNISEQWIFTVPDISQKGEIGSAQPDVTVKPVDHDEHQIDFDLSLPDDVDSVHGSGVANGLSDISTDLASIDLNLGDEVDTKPQSAKEYSEAEEMQWQEVETKLNLARAYLEMDDKEGTREILEEILREGDDEQQSTARSMLEKIS